MLINNVKLGKSIEQKIKLRILYSIILLILAAFRYMSALAFRLHPAMLTIHLVTMWDWDVV